MRDTSHALSGKTQIETISGGSIVAIGTLAPLNAATRHWSHSSIAISTAASAHSIQ